MATKKPSPKKKPAEPAPRPSRKAKPKKLGRPPRSGEASSAVTVRLTSKERTHLEGAAAREGKSLAAYIRDAALLKSEKT